MAHPLRQLAGLFWLLSGFLLWAVAFASFYALHGTLCSVTPSGLDPEALLWATLGGAALLHAGLCWILHRRAARAGPSRGAERRIAFWLAVAAGLSSVASLAPGMALGPCEPPPVPPLVSPGATAAS